MLRTTLRRYKLYPPPQPGREACGMPPHMSSRRCINSSALSSLHPETHTHTHRAHQTSEQSRHNCRCELYYLMKYFASGGHLRLPLPNGINRK
eukprot:6184624-Pleurochrysis_carterae.AAC.2